MAAMRRVVQSEGLSGARKLLILGICCFSLFMVGLDVTIVNVALPVIHRDLHASLSGLQWTIDAYTLVLASLLMLAGSTADRIGRKRVFQLGLTLFSTGSLLCALAPTLGALVAFRIVQAIGGTMLNPVAMSIIRTVFDDPRERARAIGVWGAAAGLSFALGPIIGGALVDSVGWRSVFLVNVPVGLLGIVLTAFFVPDSRSPRPRRIDAVGQFLVITGLGTCTYAIIEGPQAGWTSGEILGLFATSLLAFIGLARYELRRNEPLIDIRFFGSVPFSGASLIAVCSCAALGGFLFLNTLYLQNVRGLSPLHAGIYLLPLALTVLVAALVSGHVVGRYGTRVPLLVSGTALTVGGLLLTGVGPHTAPSHLAIAYVIFGLGFGLVNVPITNTAISGMPPAQAGVAAAIASTSRQVGTTLGVALVGAVAGSAISSGIARDFASASRPGWWLIVGAGFVVLVLGATSTTRWARATARSAAERLGVEGLPVAGA